MIKDDERIFLAYMQVVAGPRGQLLEKIPRELINEPGFPMSYKRAWYLLEKWSGKGLYDYGVTVDLGWMTPAGMKVDPWTYNGENLR